uniref:Uncharacterized protein n=1 Tax=Tanacetum cinerariifolium TaxID=118510 RepID=A0A6L2J0Y2_TANCI|nr:hypothetical protein [Tanacetum cinerariifolium]
MALPDKHPLKFNIHKDAKSLMDAIEKMFGDNKETKRNKADLEDQSLDELFNNLKIYEAEVKSSSSTSHTTQNIAFLSTHNTNSTNESVSAVSSVSTASTKPPASILSNVDNLSDAVIYSFFASQSNSPQLDNDDLKQIDADDLEEIDLNWQMAMLTMRARRFLQRTGRNLGANGTTSLGVMVLVAMIGAFRQIKNQQIIPSWHSPPQVLQVITVRKSQFDVLSYRTCLESVKARLVVYQQNENVFEEDIKLLKHDVMLRDIALVELRKKFEKVKKERDELKLTLENFQTSSKNLSKLLASQITDKTNLGYDNQMFLCTVFDCAELNSSESDFSVPTSPVHDRYKSGKWYHAFPPPYTRTFMPPKIDLVFHDASTVCKTISTVINVEPSSIKPNKDMSQLNRPSAPIIEDWIFDSKNKCEGEPMPTQKGNPQQALKDKGVIDSGCLRHMIGNMSYLSNFEEINRGYVAFGRNPKGGKITGKGKIKTCKLDFDDVYFVKELKFNMFSVSQMGDKKNKVLFTDTKCVVLSSEFKLPDENHVLHRPTLDESNLWHRRPGHINFKTMIKLVKGFMRPFRCPVTIINTLDSLGKFDGKADEGFLVRYSSSSKAFRVFNSRTRIVQETLHINFLKNQPNVVGSGPTWLFNIDTLIQSMNYQLVVAGTQPNSSVGIQENLNSDVDAAFDVKENESEVHVSPSSSEKRKKHDEKAKSEDKGKSPVELSTRVRDLSDEFEEFSINSTNRVNAASAPVTAVRPNSTNSTNSFSAAGPSNTTVHSNFEIGGKSLFVDPSQYPDDPNMPALEEIIYSDDEEDVGAKADFSNLETSITVSPIPKNRVHKDHPVTQIIGDLSLAPETRSMARMVKEQDGLTQINDRDFHTCMFACFISQEEPKRLHQALKDLSWIEDIVVKALYGLHQAPRAWYETLANYLFKNGFQKGKIDQTLFIRMQKGLQVKKKDDRIFNSQDKCVAEILRKFGITYGKSASTPIDTKKPLLKDPNSEDVDVHIYSDYAGASLDRKSTTGGCQFLCYRLISWQCRKQNDVATSSTEAEYVAATSCCAQVLWIQNQLLDYGILDFLYERSCTSKRAKVYCECMEPFKSLMRLWVRTKSIALIWLEKVVTPLIEAAIKVSLNNIYE